MSAARIAPVRFLFGAQEREFSVLDPTMSILDWLRNQERMTGTKEGCAEGDCGACTVLVGRLRAGKLIYEAVNACIRFTATLHGCHLVTVEHLKRANGALHPVQQAIVDCHGSQCGFCTPGFVMALYALWLNEDRPDRARINQALQGNLCRCTGYLPIIRAAERMYELGSRSDDVLVKARMKTVRRLKEIRNGKLAGVAQDGRSLLVPATASQLAAAYAAEPRARLVNGATDVGLWVTKKLQDIAPVIYLGLIDELQAIERRKDHLWIGAGVSYTDAWPHLEKHFPTLGELVSRIGGNQVRNMGTIGGNIANGSPIGDTPPPFIALGATLVLRLGRKRRRLPLEDFFIDYGKQDRQKGEFVEGVELPFLPKRSRFAAYKISKRIDEDISALCGAFRLDFDGKGRIAQARIAFGGMAATPKRALRAEGVLAGRNWNDEACADAIAALAGDYRPISDMRASAGYRLLVAQNLLRRFFLETAQDRSDARLSLAEVVHG